MSPKSTTKFNNAIIKKSRILLIEK
ncbi:hypothetical protein B14911_25690 [Bacillus sp. NRRL B-14911]|nr:hypothetical protein B14911_25690 [Bacillus sp. NRRL B-14911]